MIFLIIVIAIICGTTAQDGDDIFSQIEGSITSNSGNQVSTYRHCHNKEIRFNTYDPTKTFVPGALQRPKQIVVRL